MNEAFKSYFNSLARRFGYEFIPTWRMEGCEFSQHLRALFSSLQVQCVFDVGANKGQYRDFLRLNIGYTGKIISFEPIKKNVRILQERADADNNWVILDYALGSSSGNFPINVMARDVFSSFLNPDVSHTSEFSHLNVVEKMETVSVKRLDDVIGKILSEYGAEKIYLKLDTQGYDLEVMKGAESSISKILALQSEMSVLQIYKDMPDYLTSLKFLSDCGFDLTGMFPVTSDKNLRLVEFDCVMINKRIARNKVDSSVIQ